MPITAQNNENKVLKIKELTEKNLFTSVSYFALKDGIRGFLQIFCGLVFTIKTLNISASKATFVVILMIK